MKYILVYADTVDELRENVVDDNIQRNGEKSPNRTT